MNCHGDVLLFGICVVLIDIQHYHSIGKSERSIIIGKRVIIRRLKIQLIHVIASQSIVRHCVCQGS
jgi:hypothetical protein